MTHTRFVFGVCGSAKVYDFGGFMSQLQRVSFALEQEREYIHITPPGPVVVARDKRMFQITDAAKVIARSELPMLVDWEHDSEKWDGSTRSAGWIESLEARPTGIWGRVAWTPDGQRDVSSLSYRYLSPVLELDGSDTREVLSIVSVALTNRPALTMSSIGDTSAYRERIRIACSQRSADKPNHASFSEKERTDLRSQGWSDDRIKRVEAHKARLYQHAPVRGFQAMTSAERAQHLREGWSQQEIDAVEAQRRRMYEPERGDAAGLQSATTPDWHAGALANVARFKRERGIE